MATNGDDRQALERVFKVHGIEKIIFQKYQSDLACTIQMLSQRQITIQRSREAVKQKLPAGRCTPVQTYYSGAREVSKPPQKTPNTPDQNL